jgi:hypothetical protein
VNLQPDEAGKNPEAAKLLQWPGGVLYSAEAVNCGDAAPDMVS